MTRYIKLLLVALLLTPLSACLQTPKDHLAASGEDTCTILADIFTINQGDIIYVDRNRPDVGIATWIVERIENVMQVATLTVFRTLESSEPFLDIINTLIALTIAIYALSILLGVTQANGYTLVMLSLKIVFVWTLATNWDIFNDLVIQNVEDIVRAMSEVMANVFSEGVRIPSIQDTTLINDNNLFNYVDKTITMFFSSGYWKAILGTFSSGWTGAIYALLLFFMMLTYMFAMIDALKTYIVSLIARSLLFALAPIFLIFLLFKQTKSMFDGWVEQIISFSFQPIFIMAFIGMFQLIFTGFMSGIIPAAHAGQKVCYGPWMEISGWLPYLYWWRLGDGGDGSPIISGTDADIPFNIWVILTMLIMMSVMQSMVQWSVEVAARLAGGFITAFDVPIQGWDEVRNRFGSPFAAAASSARGALSGGDRNRAAYETTRDRK